VMKSRDCGISKPPPITQKPKGLGVQVIIIQAVCGKERDKQIFLKEKEDEKVDTYLFCSIVNISCWTSLPGKGLNGRHDTWRALSRRSRE
jgi:hypothetical protein